MKIASTFYSKKTCLTQKQPWLAPKIIFFIVFLLILSSSSQAKVDTPSFRILYINSYHPGYSWADRLQKGLLETLDSSGKQIEISIEYLDNKRFPNLIVPDKVADTIATKYKDFLHDLVVVSDNAAFTFAIKNRARLFPDIPIIFCGYNSFRPEVISGLSNITGVNEELYIKGLIETAHIVQPDLKILVFTLSTGDDSSVINTNYVETEIIPIYKDKYQIVILKDAPIVQIKEALDKLPGESALFIIGQTKEDIKGRALSPRENGQLISAVSPIPVYTLWNFHLGTGVVGGRIGTGYDQGKAAGEMVLQILNGTRADDIPVLMESPTSHIFDYTVMKRFGITIDDLPENSTVLNKPDSFYETNTYEPSGCQ